jgi:cytochrome c biogenesis protein CcdA
MALIAFVRLVENVTRASPIATAMTPIRIAYSRADTASLARTNRRNRRDRCLVFFVSIVFIVFIALLLVGVVADWPARRAGAV